MQHKNINGQLLMVAYSHYLPLESKIWIYLLQQKQLNHQCLGHHALLGILVGL